MLVDFPEVIHSLERTATWTATLGAVPTKGGAQFTVWAPEAERVDVVLVHPDYSMTRALSRLPNGCFSAWEPDVEAGTRYCFRLNGGHEYPDPASRFQPDGVHGASMVVDPNRFEWTDDGWRGVARDELVVYELHVGTFTPEGTFAGVQSRLEYLASLGVTAIELMPVAEAAGTRNWGYDGVDLFAPSHHYGTPDDLRLLVDAAHRHGLAVILDVVYNHVGPDGAYLSAFSASYFTTRHASPWGPSVNLDGEGSEQVRAFLIENALHWIAEYRVDGLRLDATHTLVDHSALHFLAELSERVRATTHRPVILIAEDERNLTAIVEPRPRGYGLDAVWADDFHHHIRRAVAGDSEGYFADFSGSARDLAATIRQGWFYTGQTPARSGEPRGTDPAGIDPRRMVICLQNHDQIGNRAFGDRLHHHIDLATYRAISALLLFAPETPLLFMGQEWAATSPFLFFTDHDQTIGRLVTEGRRSEFSEFSAFTDERTRDRIPDPQDPETFAASRLAWDEMWSPSHAGVLRLYRGLIALRRHVVDRVAGSRLVSAEALDEHTVAVAHGTHAIVARLAGAGRVSLDPPLDLGARTSARDVVLTTEDREFAVAGRPPRVIVGEAGAALIEFDGPAAVIVRRRPRETA